jgi:tripartite-type tricarboxylate transporter receptor subunit TctC
MVLSSIRWVAAPAGTSDAIVNLLADAFRKGFSEQAFKDTSDNLGATEEWQSPEDSLKTMEKVDQLYQRVVKKYNLKPE